MIVCWQFVYMYFLPRVGFGYKHCFWLGTTVHAATPVASGQAKQAEPEESGSEVTESDASDDDKPAAQPKQVRS